MEEGSLISMTSVLHIARWLTAKSTPSGRGLKEIAISEERAIQHAMEQARPGRAAQVERAARILGISRATCTADSRSTAQGTNLLNRCSNE